MASLHNIKKLKQHKLTSAESALREAKQALIEWRAEYQRTVEQSDSYTQWRIAEEDRQYQQIENKILRTAQLEEVRERIASMHNKDAKLKERVLAVEHEVQKALAHEDACRAQVRNLEKDLEKYDLLIAEEQKEIFMMQERQSEDVLDEFASTTIERNDHVDTIH